MAAFSQFYGKNREKKAVGLWFGQKRSAFKVVEKEGVVIEEIRTIKKKPNT
jgi:hypothetical protein